VLALAQMRYGRIHSFEVCMAAEFRIVSRIVYGPDMVEGVRAVITDKTNDPKWDPATPQEVSDELLDAIFAPLPADEEWKPL
jgi:enoyl-CoA hydratase